MTDVFNKVKFPGVHNVFKLVEAKEDILQLNRNQPENLVVNPYVQKLIDRLHVRNPKWEFVASGYGSSEPSGSYIHSRFAVHCDGEELGWVGSTKDWRKSDDKYEFDCERLRKQRQKNITPYTKDLNKAVKTITANMYNHTPAERMLIARNKTASTVQRFTGNATYSYGNVQSKMVDHMVRFVEAHWQEFCAVEMDMDSIKARDTLIDRKRVVEDTLTIANPLNNAKGYLLIEAGGKFLVGDYGLTDIPVSMRLDEMPDKLKGSLGILKLLEEKQYAAGIGTRVDKTTFYVVDADG